MADAQGNTPLHIAAFCSNYVAIETLCNHFNRTGQTLDLNIANTDGATPLDAVGQIMQNSDVNKSKNRHYFNTLRRNTARTYQCLRKLGACRGHELTEKILIRYVVSIPQPPHPEVSPYSDDIAKSSAV
jgi:hypothetical protein